jgi:hypothetical protein
LLLTTFNHSGNPGDPTNIQICGTDGQIGAAFASAGWYRADEIDFITTARICKDSILGRAYSTAPVSNLFLFGRKEDLAFERPVIMIANAITSTSVKLAAMGTMTDPSGLAAPRNTSG